MPINYPVTTPSVPTSSNASQLRGKDINTSFVPQEYETVIWNPQQDRFDLGFPFGSAQKFTVLFSTSSYTGTLFFTFPEAETGFKEINWNTFSGLRTFETASSFSYNGTPYFAASAYIPRKYGGLFSASFDTGSNNLGYQYPTEYDSPVYIIQDSSNPLTGTIEQSQPGGGGGGGGGSSTFLYTVYAPGIKDASATGQELITKFYKAASKVNVYYDYQIDTGHTGSVYVSGNFSQATINVTGTTTYVYSAAYTNMTLDDNFYSIYVSSSNASSNFKIYNITLEFFNT